MVVALAFGVLFDFFLTLMLVPAMYCIGVDIGRFFKGLWVGERQPPLGAKYNPDMVLALEGMDFIEDVKPEPRSEPRPFGDDDGIPSPAE